MEYVVVSKPVWPFFGKRTPWKGRDASRPIYHRLLAGRVISRDGVLDWSPSSFYLAQKGNSGKSCGLVYAPSLDHISHTKHADVRYTCVGRRPQNEEDMHALGRAAGPVSAPTNITVAQRLCSGPPADTWATKMGNQKPGTNGRKYKLTLSREAFRGDRSYQMPEPRNAYAQAAEDYGPMAASVASMGVGAGIGMVGAGGHQHLGHFPRRVSGVRPSRPLLVFWGVGFGRKMRPRSVRSLWRARALP